MTALPLTSADNPLRIAELPAGPGGGAIGITFAPGKTQPGGMTGAHRRDLRADLDRVAAWNASVVVTLVEPHELKALRITELGAEVRRRHMEWEHWPIADYSVPDATFEAEWPARSARLRQLLACGGRVLIHCKGGLGRAGTVGARLLVELGTPAAEAIAAVRTVRPGAIETRGQEGWVAAGRATPLQSPERDHKAARDRALGALLGLAVGDAVGAVIEFSPKPRYAVLDDMVAGGPHRLERGQWTDDTAMALALADSLLTDPALDAADLMRRFLDWYNDGTYSCTGHCFDIGIQTRAALERFRESGDPLAGSTAPSASGNGALMRLAPVAIRFWRDGEAALRAAEWQTRTTHGSPATLAASRAFAALLVEAIAGTALPELLRSPAADIEGGWRGLHRDAVIGSGYVVRSLQAALWAVARTTNFHSAVLLAANLGEDADTTAAIAGQLAGAVYGASAIPQEWLAALAWRERIEGTASQLFEAGGLRDRLEALAAFDPVFCQPGFAFAVWHPATTVDGLIHLGGSSLTEEADRFYKMLYEYGWIRSFDWPRWRETERGQALLHNPAALMQADADELANVLTTCVRADRFCDGYLSNVFEAGLIGRVTARAVQLLALTDHTTPDSPEVSL